MKKIDKVTVTILAVTTLIVLSVGYYLHTTSKRVAICRDHAEVRYNYISRKLCDPYANEACRIDPELQTELDVWYEEELALCK